MLKFCCKKTTIMMNFNFFWISTIIPACVWLFIIFFHGRNIFSRQPFFWTSKIIFEKIHQKKNFKIKKNSGTCVIIPARNEEKFIKSTLQKLINQEVNNLYVTLIDDNSNDNTVSTALKTFTDNNFKSYQIINGKALPKGWTGKVWALKQGIDSISTRNFDYILFMDSDIGLENHILSNTINFLESNQLSMISLMARLNCSTLWEKFLIPPFIFFFQKIYPFNLVNDKENSLSAAAGGFILCKSTVFSKKNLFDSIKDRIIDDCSLAKLVKQNGNIWLGLTNQIFSKRKYSKLSEIWEMVSRTAFEQLNYSIILLLLTVFGLCVLYIIPIFNLILINFSENFFLTGINIITILFVFMSVFPTFKFYGLNFFYCLSLPFSAFLYGLMTISSACNYYFNHGNLWKGRKY